MLDENALNAVFNHARTHHGWQDKPVTEALLKEIFQLAKMGPTSANCCPLRIVFVMSDEGKERLKPCLNEGNIEQTMAAPVTAIFGHDLEFYEHFELLSPHNPAVKSWFEGKPAYIKETAFRNGTLQTAYFMLAARSLGLDCGPMSGFDNKAVDKEFFKGTKIKSNFLCNIGYGDPEKLYPRAPRFSFEEVCFME